MFSEIIQQTPFISEEANCYYPNINGQHCLVDVSFLSTLRALLGPRIRDDENVHLYFLRSQVGFRFNVGQENIAQCICNANDYCTAGTLFIHDLMGPKENINTILDAIQKEFSVKYPNYHRVEKVNLFYRKSFSVDCYINERLKSTVVFIGNLGPRNLHYLQVSIPIFFPWYFNPKDGLSSDELALIESLRSDTKEGYVTCTNRLADKLDFKAAYIKSKLNGFETRYEREMIKQLQNENLRIDREIESLNRQIGNNLSSKEANFVTIMGLQQKIQQGEDGQSEIMDYFLCNKKLLLKNVTDTYMEFVVKCHYEFFDREMAEKFIKNKESYVHTHLDGNIDSKIERLLQELFVSDSPRLRMRTCAAYRLSLRGNVEGLPGSKYCDDVASQSIPNPHIHRYNCLGNYLTVINNLLMNHDYIGAVEQCIASCKSLNWADSVVMSNFMETLYQVFDSRKCIELHDGRILTPIEAIKWLDEQV